MDVVISVDGIAKWQGTTGFAARNINGQNALLSGGTPMIPNSLSRIFNVTKTFTAALVLDLANEGVLSLDDPVSAYFPLNVVNPHLVPSVTLRQLLAHESGYSDHTTEPRLQVAVASDPKHEWTAYEAIPFVHQVDLPGLKRRYSSTNYIILGAIIENVTGQKIEQHFRDRFFDPLNLSSMYFAGREAQQSPGILVTPHGNISEFNPVFLAAGQATFPNAYTNNSRFPLNAVVSLAFTGGAIVSNASDLAEWGNALFSGKATSASTLKTMLNSVSSTPDENGDYLGYGILSNRKISSTDYFIGHNGSSAGYRSVMMYQPDRKMTIAILTNFTGTDPYTIAKKLYEVLPDLSCQGGNSKEVKIPLCKSGKDVCVARNAAGVEINNGALLGTCRSNGRSPLKELVRTIADEKHKAAIGFTLSPNPVRNQATMRFTAPRYGRTSLNLYDLHGRIARAIFSGNLQKGETKQLVIQSAGLPAGTYICRLQTPDGIIQKNLVVTK